MSLVRTAPKPLGWLGDLRESTFQLVQSLRTTSRANRILAAAVVVPLLINAALLASYVGATGQRGALAAQLKDVESKILRSVPAKGAPASATSDIVLPKEMESADLMDMLLRMSQDSAVELVGVDSLGATPQRIQDKEYKAFRYRVQVRARVSQLVAFLNRLEQAQQNVLLVGNLAGSPKSGQAWLVSVDLVTYVAASGPGATPTPRQ